MENQDIILFLESEADDCGAVGNYHDYMMFKSVIEAISAKDAEIVRMREALVKIRDMRIGNPTDAIGQHANIVLGIINPTLEGQP